MQATDTSIYRSYSFDVIVYILRGNTISQQQIHDVLTFSKSFTHAYITNIHTHEPCSLHHHEYIHTFIWNGYDDDVTVGRTLTLSRTQEEYLVESVCAHQQSQAIGIRYSRYISSSSSSVRTIYMHIVNHTNVTRIKRKVRAKGNDNDSKSETHSCHLVKS